MKNALYLVIIAGISILLSFGFTHPVMAQQNDTVTLNRLKEINAALDTLIFVNRFQSIETPCFYIDPVDHSFAHTNRKIINSNALIQLTRGKEKRIDPSGIKCLSQFCARYLRLTTSTIDNQSLTIRGKVESTYGYPASSIIQYLGFLSDNLAKTTKFFEKMLRSTGTFVIFPEGDKYRIKIMFSDGPYEKSDIFSGYLEIVLEAFNPTHNKSLSFYFDEININKGDHNNQIFLKFSSTTFHNEEVYYTVLVYNTLKKKNSSILLEKANAIWLENFLTNPACTQCKPIFNSAKYMVDNNMSILPNTEPIPAH